MPREPIPSWFFVLVVVRLGRRYLLVKEPNKHGGGWYLPAGRVEPGETLRQAAIRETAEEGGIAIHLEGVLQLEYTPRPEGTVRERVIFVARPAGDEPPKQTADEESLGAAWFTLDEARRLELRGAEVLGYLEQVEAGGPILPIAHML